LPQHALAVLSSTNRRARRANCAASCAAGLAASCAKVSFAASCLPAFTPEKRKARSSIRDLRSSRPLLCYNLPCACAHGASTTEIIVKSCSELYNASSPAALESSLELELFQSLSRELSPPVSVTQRSSAPINRQNIARQSLLILRTSELAAKFTKASRRKR